jgi:2-haloacid dehalogenase
MDEFPDIEVVVFDVLGTLLDIPSGLWAALRDAVPDLDESAAEELVTAWEDHFFCEMQRIGEGRRAYVATDVIDREAAERVAVRAGLTDPVVIGRLAAAGRRLPPWPDSVAGLDRLARHLPVVGLSNASRADLLRASAHAGLRWHQVLSTETVGAYKPAPEVYQLAIDVAGCPPDRVLMVAAHAWDLRGAQAMGMRTAYVERPVGDPPTPDDAFDGQFAGLEDLARALTSP